MNPKYILALLNVSMGVILIILEEFGYWRDLKPFVWRAKIFYAFFGENILHISKLHFHDQLKIYSVWPEFCAMSNFWKYRKCFWESILHIMTYAWLYIIVVIHAHFKKKRDFFCLPKKKKKELFSHWNF